MDRDPAFSDKGHLLKLQIHSADRILCPTVPFVGAYYLFHDKRGRLRNV